MDHTVVLARVKRASRGLSKLGVSALWLAASGYKVHPLRPGGKARLMSEDEFPSTDLFSAIRKAWLDTPEANVGMNPSDSGLVVIDQDTHDGANGPSAWAEICIDHGHEEDPGMRAKTQSGGVHSYFMLPSSMTSVAGKIFVNGAPVPGIDVIHRQNVVLPPSIGEQGGYFWIEDGRDLARQVPPDAPGWLLDMIERKKELVHNAGKLVIERCGNAKKYSDWVFRSESELAGSAEPGERNRTIFKSTAALSRLIGNCDIGEDDVVGVMMTAAGSNGLLEEDGERKVMATIQSGLKAGAERRVKLIERGDPIPEGATGVNTPVWKKNAAGLCSGVDVRDECERSPIPLDDEGDWLGPISRPAPEPEPVADEPPDDTDHAQAIRDLVAKEIGIDPGVFPPDDDFGLAGRVMRGGDIGAGAALAWATRKIWRHVPSMGSDFVFDGKRWRHGAEATSELFGYAASMMQGIEYHRKMMCGFTDSDASKASSKMTLVKHILPAIKVAMSMNCIRGKPEDFDSHPHLFAASNGIIDLRTGRFTPGHDPKLMITKISPVPWVEGGTVAELAPTFLRFMRDSFVDDDTIDTMKRFAGNTITGYGTRYVKKFMVLVGVTNSGKGTFVHCVTTVMGREYVKTLGMGQLSGAMGRGPNSGIAQLPGKRFAVVEDTGDMVVGNKVIDGEILKRLTSGGDSMTANEKNKPEYDFYPTCTVMLCTNADLDIPYSAAKTYRERMHIVRMNQNHSTNRANIERGISKPYDPNLKEKLAAEASGILKWMVEGAIMFTTTKSWGSSVAIEEAGDSMVEDSKTIYEEFAEECLSTDNAVQACRTPDMANFAIANNDLRAAFIGYASRADANFANRTPSKMSINKRLRTVMLQHDLFRGIVESSKHVYPLGSDNKTARGRGWKYVGLTRTGFDAYQRGRFRAGENRVED